MVTLRVGADEFVDLLRGTAVLHTRTRRAHNRLARSREAPLIGPKVDYEHFHFMLEAAKAGSGVSVAPWPYVVDDIKAGRLKAPHGFIDSGHQYVALRRARRNRKASLFCNWLANEASKFSDSEPAPSV